MINTTNNPRLSNLGYYPGSFQGPVKPGQTIGGVNPLGQKAPSNLLVQQPKQGNGGGGGGNTGGGGSDKGSYVGEIRDGRRWTGVGWDDAGGGGNGEQDLSSLISEMYDPYMKELSDMEGTIQSEYAGDEKNLIDQYGLYNRQAQDQEGELIRSTDKEQGKYNDTLKSAYEESLRGYNALNQQGRVRFGRGSSAGQAVGELAQREFFREQGKIGNKQAEGDLQFAEERGRIKKYVKDKIDQLDINKTTAMSELKNTLRARLDEVRSRKYDIEANKTKDKIAVLTDTINQARELKRVDQEFRRNLGLAAVSKMQEIQGRAFTPQEIAVVMGEFGIEVGNIGAGRQQQGTTAPVRRTNNSQDELAALQGGGILG